MDKLVQNVLFLEKLLEGHGPVTLYGAIPTGSDEEADTRKGRIRRFHTDSGCRIMIANPAACSEGISPHSRPAFNLDDDIERICDIRLDRLGGIRRW